MSTKPETMDAETLEALRGSIRKWEGIVAGTVEDEGAANCPLCIKFAPEHASNRCDECPVRKATGRRGCAGSPYEKYDDLSYYIDPEFASDDELAELRAAAQAELDFLKSLLPTGAA